MDNNAILVQKALNKKASIAANSLLKVNSYLNKIDSALEGVCELDTQSRSGDVIAKLALHRTLKMNSDLFLEMLKLSEVEDHNQSPFEEFKGENH